MRHHSKGTISTGSSSAGGFRATDTHPRQRATPGKWTTSVGERQQATCKVYLEELSSRAEAVHLCIRSDSTRTRCSIPTRAQRCEVRPPAGVDDVFSSLSQSMVSVVVRVCCTFVVFHIHALSPIGVGTRFLLVYFHAALHAGKLGAYPVYGWPLIQSPASVHQYAHGTTVLVVVVSKITGPVWHKHELTIATMTLLTV